MIFKQWQQVLDGTKTQTRRLALDTDYTWICGHRYRADGTAQALYSEIRGESGRCKFVRDRTYAIVPKMGKPAIPGYRIVVMQLRREHLHDITESDAKLEGVNSVAEYRELWDSLATKGTRWINNPAVWVITFELMQLEQTS